MISYCRQRLLDAYDNDIWDAGRKIVSAIWDAIGWTWHGKKRELIIIFYPISY